MSSHLYKRIIDIFNKNPTENELEIRFKNISPEIFKKALSLASGGDISRCLDVRHSSFENRHKSYVHRLCFDEAGKRDHDEYYIKENLHSPYIVNDFITYKIAVASEKHEKHGFPSTADPLYRFKIRLSKEFIEGWYIDVTATYTTNALSIKDGVKKMVADLFARKYSPNEKLFDELPLDIIGNNFEIEFERKQGQKWTESLDTLKEKVLIPFFEKLSPNYNELREYNEILYDIAKLLHLDVRYGNFGLKRLGNKAQALSRFNYQNDIYPPIGYYITEKADGIRTLVYVKDDTAYMVSNTIRKIKLKTNVTSPILADSEFVEGVGYLLFDVMIYLGEKTYETAISNRIEYLKPIADIVPETIVKKYYKIADNIEDTFRKVYEAKYKYEIDGIILTTPNKPYFQTTNYKWKPFKNLTIDFMCKKCPKELLGKPPYNVREGKTLYLLFCGIASNVMKRLGVREMSHFKKIFPILSSEIYRPIQFSSSFHPYAYIAYLDKADLDSKIVELGPQKGAEIKQGESFDWEFHRVRDDRSAEINYFGNDYRVAESVFGDILDPFYFEALFEEASSYFKQVRDNIYVAPNFYKRYLVGQLMDKYGQNSEWAIDLGGGRGADIKRYIENKIHKIMFIDIDKTAIAELVSRKFKFSNMRDMEIYAMVADLTDNWEGLLRRVHAIIPNLKANFALCNFAFHYFCGTEKDMKNVLRLTSEVLTGHFIITCMDGKKVHKKLLEHDGSYEAYEGDVLKYAIDADYSADRVTASGQMIDVLLPFSNGEKYSEPLCNLDAVIENAKKYKLKCKEYGDFTKFLKDFEQFEPVLYNKLTPEDKEFIELHSYVVLYK